VEARDDLEVIGGGIHRRVVVSVPRFDARIQRKVPRGGTRSQT
jgi:predicted thioesterase